MHRNRIGATALHVAANTNHSLEVAKLLLQHGADVKAKCSKDR